MVLLTVVMLAGDHDHQVQGVHDEEILASVSLGEGNMNVLAPVSGYADPPLIPVATSTFPPKRGVAVERGIYPLLGDQGFVGGAPEPPLQKEVTELGQVSGTEIESGAGAREAV